MEGLTPQIIQKRRQSCPEELLTVSLTKDEKKTCSTEFEQIACQLEFKHQSQIFKLLPLNYD